MVSSVTSTPYTYDTSSAAATTPASTTASTTDNTDSSGSDLPTDTVTLSPDVQALLSQLVSGTSSSSDSSNVLAQLLGGSNSSNPIAQLFGSGSSSNTSQFSVPTDGLTANVYSALLKAAYSGAAQKAASQATNSPVQNVIDGYNAYQTSTNSSPTDDEVQAVLDANQVLPDSDLTA